tara:strand:- start:395 stop:586 length:192 start_codon:yes stop_codon:yes gene_type:complete
MMAQIGYDYKTAIPAQTICVHAAIANWENEGGAVLPTTKAAQNWRRTSKTPPKRSDKITRKNH